ncbi:enoyl-CoA hydratase/isomerase family protein [Sedimenticola selenatireducens]|uniref:enoyl-CoA hydratase/isomerase family protein n=1 Tax=Sedimenticola selenatireducens TaxID=191960 RepID=UPI003F4ADBEC
MISLEIDGAVATATLSRAPVNAISDEWIERLEWVLNETSANPDLSALRIRSAEKVFCAGADLAVMRSRFTSEAGRLQMVELAAKMQRVFAQLEAMPMVTVAQIEGAALGGGLELALACDLRVVADTARIGLPEAGLGLLPGAGGTQRLTRLCGDAVARRMILSAEVLDGVQAEKLGVVHWVADKAQLPGLVDELLVRIGRVPRDAITECKRCIQAALDPDQDGYAIELEGTQRLYENPISQEIVRRFLDKAG